MKLVQVAGDCARVCCKLMIDSDIATHFSRAAREFPECMAVWSSEQKISYRDLDRQSSALANWLLRNRKSADGLLGMMLPKSVEAVVAIIAGLKANMPYAPVDPSWPARRRESIFRQSGFDILIAEADCSERDIKDMTVLSPDTAAWTSVITEIVDADYTCATRSPGNLAYILYTSGSTGDPKGVCVSSSAAYHFPNWAREKFSINKKSRVASHAPFTFDLSTFDLFSSLCAGATVYLVPEMVKLLPSSLSRFLEEHSITTIYAVPSNLGLLAARGSLERRDLSALETVLFAGEVFPLPLFRDLESKLPGHVRYYNLYGPTETNVCTYFDMANIQKTDTAIPIGLPLPGTELFTLTDEGEYADVGVEGELCVDGPTVMSGYWGAEDVNADCWVTTPGDSESKAYRTGDYASMREDGNWLYFGRRDNMVKIWGYRVELGEIESCLLTYAGIEQAAVVKVAQDGEFGDALVAFVVSNVNESENLNSFDVVKYCRKNLPSYMCLQAVHLIEKMPLSHNGKIERRELAAKAEQLGS
jgi:amino acid adenylation domain-containing protein